MTETTSMPLPVLGGDDLRAAQCHLHERVTARDELALLELYDLVADLVFCAAFRLTGSRQAAAALTEALFVELWRSPEHFAPKGGPVGLQMIRRMVEQAPGADRAA